MAYTRAPHIGTQLLLRTATSGGKSNGPRLNGDAIVKRHTTNDFVRTKIGSREIVGFGWNGSPVYCDHLAYPMPAVRFREPTKEICVLRTKELSDWKKLSVEEKKLLYRYSFRQTFAEMKAPSGEWKALLGVAIWVCAMGIAMTCSYYFLLYEHMPQSFEDGHKRAQLRRMLALQMNPITGIASKFDYDTLRWK